MAGAVVQIIEMDQERDRKTCVALDQKVTGANRELAQWCLDHPMYSQREIAKWLGCGNSRVFYLRKWAASGFEGSPYDSENRPDSRPPDHRSRPDSDPARDQSRLKSLNNSEFDFEDDDDADDDSAVATPAVVIDNLLHSIGGMNESARVFNKVLKASAFDREAVTKINTAIDRMIKKWRSIQSTLEKKG